jgi:hypothetical protein
MEMAAYTDPVPWRGQGRSSAKGDKWDGFRSIQQPYLQIGIPKIPQKCCRNIRFCDLCFGAGNARQREGIQIGFGIKSKQTNG